MIRQKDANDVVVWLTEMINLLPDVVWCQIKATSQIRSLSVLLSEDQGTSQILEGYIFVGMVNLSVLSW
jgi:hypothetical protein